MKKKNYIELFIAVLGAVLVSWCMYNDVEPMLVRIVGLIMTFGPLALMWVEGKKKEAEEEKQRKEAYEKERVEFVNSFNSRYNGVNELTREQIAEDPQYYYNLMCKIVEDMMRYKDFYEYLDLDFEKVDSLQKQIEELWIRKFETQLVGKDEFYAFLEYHDWYLLNRKH